jgi:uracil-DNA glycosylase family 4
MIDAAIEAGIDASILASILAPGHDCALCPRLVAYRVVNQTANPSWFNGPVPSFGPADGRLLIVGMAPGVKGANRTGRPFTGDHAGMLLYQTLAKVGLSEGVYAADPTDGVILRNCRIVNAVRCVPPANLPQPAEVKTCNQFLQSELHGMPNLQVVLALGVLAHAAVLRACGIKQSQARFQHAKVHTLPDGLMLANSYHVSRYNTSTRRLTTEMFEAVMLDIAKRIT